MTLSTALAFAQGVLFLVFSVSLVPKFRNWRRFVSTVRVFTSAGDATARIIAVCASGCELVAAVLVPWNSATSTVAFALGVALLGCYTVAIALARMRGSTVGCNCFGESQQPVSWFDVARNVVFTAVFAVGLAASLSDPSAATPSLKGLCLVVAGVVVMLAVHLRDVAVTIIRPIGSVESA
jgi:uncharacterized membrane protein YphA (DoxX/SURF4 family)